MIGSMVLDRRSAEQLEALTRMNSDRPRVSSRGILFLAGKTCKIMKIYSEVSQMRRTIFCAMVVLALLTCPLFSEAGEKNYGSGISMKVSGKVIHRETGGGIPGITVLIAEINTGDIYYSITNNDGIFEIRMIPQGIYEISKSFINMSCPEELIVSEVPEIIKVSTGRNIIDLKIFLQTGASISGYVYASDGVTPLKDVEISTDPWIYGKVESVLTDANGKYIIKGVAAGAKLVDVSAQGFAHESILLAIKQGDNFENINFILGKGNVSVKGKVISAIDNQVIKNASVFFIYQDPNQYYSAGYAKTDENGNYSIIGLKYPGTFELSIVHDEYDESDSYIPLKNGENIINLNLESKIIPGMTKTAIINASAQNNSNTENCKCNPNYNHDYDALQDDMCNILNEKGDCVGDSIVLECQKYRCDKRNYTIICDPNCPPKISARIRTTDLNIGKDGEGTIFLCTNNGIHSQDEIKKAIFHELFHMCDRGGNPEKSSCSEWRDYRATYCIFKNKTDKRYRNKFKVDCFDCLLYGINCY